LAKIRVSTTIKAPLDRVFRFIADGENAPRWHPSIVEAKRIESTKLGVGSTVRYRAKLGPLEIVWVTRAEKFEWNKEFHDILVRVEKGPLKAYEISGIFLGEEERTHVILELEYALAWGPLGSLLDTLIISHRVKKHLEEGLNKAKELLEAGAGLAFSSRARLHSS